MTQYGRLSYDPAASDRGGNSTKIGNHSFPQAASLSTCATAAKSKSRSRWQTMSRPAQLVFMIGVKDELSLDETERIMI
jgi:hypothetical protein